VGSDGDSDAGTEAPARRWKIGVELVIAIVAAAAAVAALKLQGILLTLVLVGAALLAIVAVNSWPHRRRVIALLLAALAVAGAGLIAFVPGDNSGQANPKSSVTTTGTVPSSEMPSNGESPSVEPTSDDSPSDPPTTSEAPPPPEIHYLTDLKYVDHDQRATSGYYLTDGPYSANGKEYPHGIAMSSGCQNRDGGDYWVDFDIGRKYAKLVGEVALDDKNSAGIRMKYQLFVDGASKAGKTLPAGQTDRLNVDVTGGLRLRLLVHDPRPRNFTSCGSEGRAFVIWGDLQLSGR
jgi:hypothetical protein